MNRPQAFAVVLAVPVDSPRFPAMTAHARSKVMGATVSKVRGGVGAWIACLCANAERDDAAFRGRTCITGCPVLLGAKDG